MNKVKATALEKLTEEERAEYWACLALRYGKNIGARTRCKLVKHFKSAFIAVHNTEKWEEAKVATMRNEGIKDNSWRNQAKIEWENAKDLEGEIILWTDKRYPTQLKELPDAPLFFYTLGNPLLLSSPSIAIVGSRACSDEGKMIAKEFASILSYNGVTVVSGMARGVDKAAHHGSLKEVGSSIGVLGCGIDVIYPPRNEDTYFLLREKGLIISEFPPGTMPDPRNFPIRNRIISGLSLGVVIIEAGLKSGSLVTAKLALEQNRSVFAVPGGVHSPYSVGCQELIRQGAKAVFHPKDILEDLFPQLKAKILEINLEFQKEILSPGKKQESKLKNEKKHAFPENSTEYQVVYALKNEKKHIDTLCQELNISPEEILVALTQLEFSDHIIRHEGGFFSL